MFSVKKNVLETVALIKAYNISQVVLCPGSRNAPLIQTFSSDPFFTCHIIVDERNAAFYALGIIQATKEPVVVCCTSGSALLNFAPAVSEAYYQKLPLIVISADRTPEWIGQMDGQTIPQFGALGCLSKKNVQLPEIKNDTDLWYCNRLINEALIICKAEKAPVHINIPISEPLFDYSEKELPQARKISYYRPTKQIDIKRYAKQLRVNQKVIIVVGQNIFNPSLSPILNKFVQQINAVVITEHLSNCKSDLFISNADAILSVLDEESKNSFVPDILISIEGHIVSKRLKYFFRQNKPKQHWHVTASLDVVDLFQSLTDLVETDTTCFLENLISNSELKQDSTFYNQWKQISNRIQEPDNKIFSDISVTGKFIQKLPQQSVLHLANSSVVRNAQLFKLDDSVQVYCDRGTNGIESSLPTAIGFASAADKLVFMAIGDLSFFYTVGALWNIQHIKNLRIILINNQTGGIFHLLPGLDKASSLKKYVSAEHNTSAKKWAEAAELKYLSATNDEELDKMLDTFVSDENSNQSILLEVFTDMETSKKVSQEYYNKLKTKI